MPGIQVKATSVEAPIPRPRSERPASEAVVVGQQTIEQRIAEAHAAVAPATDLKLQEALLAKGTALAELSLFDDQGPAAELDSLKQSLGAELKRLDGVRHYKADLNQEKIRGLLQTLESNLPDEQKIATLHAQLKEIEKSYKTSSFMDTLGQIFGSAPEDPTAEASLQSVQTMVKEYLDVLHADFFTKPRPWQ